MNYLQHTLRMAAGGAALALLAACASNRPTASPQLAAVRQSIDQAQQADAQHQATRELNTARNKLNLAEQANKEGDEVRAARLAEQARLDAEYAMAVAQNKNAQSAVNALNDTLNVLREEVASGQAIPEISSGAGTAGQSATSGAGTAGQSATQGGAASGANGQ